LDRWISSGLPHSVAFIVQLSGVGEESQCLTDKCFELVVPQPNLRPNLPRMPTVDVTRYKTITTALLLRPGLTTVMLRLSPSNLYPRCVGRSFGYCSLDAELYPQG
jgi:hypothetical protein